MKNLLLLLALASPAASASVIEAAYTCRLASAPESDPVWKAKDFPLLQTDSGFEYASSAGSSSYYQLAAIDPAKLTGLPSYDGGAYYSGHDDLLVLFFGAGQAKVLKPLEMDPYTQKQPAEYSCKKLL